MPGFEALLLLFFRGRRGHRPPSACGAGREVPGVESLFILSIKWEREQRTNSIINSLPRAQPRLK